MADLHTAQWGLNNGRRLAGNSAAFPNDDEEDDMTTATRSTGEGYIDVTATMGALKTWFDSHKVTCTAADLIAAAALTLKRERDLGDADKRQKWEKAHRIGEDAP